MDDLRVRDVGEFGLIQRLFAVLPAEVQATPGLEIGVGDDAAVWLPAAGELLVMTTDSLIADIHFRLDWTDWASLGHKMLAVNVSDLAAMGAEPQLAVIAIGLEGHERIDDLESLYRGLGALASRYGMVIAGGDIVRSPCGLVLHITALGNSRRGRVLTRSGAKVGDVIGVTGNLGASAAGLQLLGLGQHDPLRRATTADLLIEAHLRPEPRVLQGAALLEYGATSAMDLSDGLLGDLPKILSASHVSARLKEREIPIAAAVQALFPDDWLELGLRGGEDYELLFTTAPGDWHAIEDAIRGTGATATIIGEIIPPESNGSRFELIGLDGRVRVESSGAFDHFDVAAE